MNQTGPEKKVIFFFGHGSTSGWWRGKGDRGLAGSGRVGQGELVAAECLERAGAAEESATQPGARGSTSGAHGVQLEEEGRAFLWKTVERARARGARRTPASTT
jgi:hypothetical protein